MAVLAHHVSHFACAQETFGSVQENPDSNILGGGFPPLERLSHFEFCDCKISLSLQEMEPFSAFQTTLSRITLEECTISKSTLFSLIFFFNNLQILNLNDICYFTSDDETPEISRTLERLTVVTVQVPIAMDFINDLSKFGLQFKEVYLRCQLVPRHREVHGGPASTDHVVHAFCTSLEWLRIPYCHDRRFNQFTITVDTVDHNPLIDTTPPELGPCCELRYLEFGPSGLHDPNESAPLDERGMKCISTIASNKIEEIIIIRPGLLPDSQEHDVAWANLDRTLTELVNRLNLKSGKLGVEFRSVITEQWAEIKERTYLPEFVTKGRMTIRNIHNKVVYSSGPTPA